MDGVLSVNIFLTIVCFAKSQSVSTIPDTDNGDAYIPIKEGEINSTVFCTVFGISNQIQTPWYIQRQGVDGMLRRLLIAPNGVPTTLIELIGDVFGTGELIKGYNDTYLTNLTFLNFTSEFDTTHLQCGDVFIDTRNFFLGFPVTPSVRNNATTQFVMEGTEVKVDLNVLQVKDPFPPMTTSMWMFNGQNLTTSSSIILNEYNITISNVQRNMSGNYTLIVTNSVGSAIGSFELDVQFPPEGIPIGGSEIVVSGSSVTLTAFLPTIGGNPVPTVSWTGPDGQIRNTSGRFNTSVPGQIMIMELMDSDNGTYTCTVKNGIPSDQIKTVELSFAVPAGPPQNLMERDVTDTTVNLTWSPPDNIGLPELIFYQLRVFPVPPSDVNLTTTSTNLLVYGIIPNTQYNVTVVGVSTGDNIDMLEGEESNHITFKTATGAPLFDSVTAIPQNGRILVQWTLRHTGGLNVDVYSYCEVDELGTDSRLISLKLCDYDDSYDGDLIGSSTTGLVQSGQTYSCIVTAVNSEGTDRRSVSNVFSLKGLPSTPIIISSVIVAGRLTLTISVGLTGTTDGSFRLNIEIQQPNNESLFRIDNFFFPNFSDNDKVTIDIDIADGGSFTFAVMAVNSFGGSVENATISGVTIERVVSSVNMDSGTVRLMSVSQDFVGSCMPTILPEAEMAGISGGVVGGIIASVTVTLVITGLVIILIMFLAFKLKGNLENKNKMANRNLSIPTNTEYEIIEKGYEKPEHLNTINVDKNIAYGEAKPPIYL